MSIFDKAGDLAKQHEDKVEAGIEQAGDFVDSNTGGKYAEHVDQAKVMANEQLDKITGADAAAPETADRTVNPPANPEGTVEP